MAEVVEELHDNNGDLTSVMTDSTSTLSDQLPVITSIDNHSNMVKDQINKQLEGSVDVDIVNESKVDESGESITSGKKSELKCENSSGFPTSTDQEKTETGSDLSVGSKETIYKNNLKDSAVVQVTVESNVSLDSGLDMDNVDKQYNLDLRSVSKKQSDGEFEKNEDKDTGTDFDHEHDTDGHSSQGEVRSIFGTVDREKTLSMDASKKRKWKFMHPFKTIMDGDFSISQCLQKVIGSYNNLQHIVYSLLTGRPVVVIGTRRQEVAVKEFVYAMSVFVPYTPRSSSVGLLCQIKQLKMSEVHKFQLRGVIRQDKRSVDYLVPKTIRRYVTLVDIEKALVYCQPYQGILLNFVTAIHNKKKTFKSDTALMSFIQLCLEEISTKAFSFYHTVTASNEIFDFSGATLPHKSSMVELSMEKYLNRAGILNSDCRLIKYLTEIVKLQQIEEEFRNKYLTDAPAHPFSVAYQSIQTYRL